MNAERLLTLYEQVADAPDAVARLRRFVLDLAVRGKLVPQDSGDEPASELLKRIAAEKARLVKAGEIKRPKPVDPVAAGEMAFPTPPGWAWTRLADIAVCLDYMRKPINGTERDMRIEGKSEDELFPYYGATQQQGWIDDYTFDEELVLLGEDGVPFFDPYRSKAYIISGKTWVNNHAHVFKGILISHPFLAHYLNVFDYTGRVVGATRSKLNQARAVDIPVPLPPLAEQRRIVAKVEELMALLDRLEAARTAREATRDRLTAASLARLTATETPPEADPAQAEAGKSPRPGTASPPDTATDTDAFPAHARFALATLPALTTRPDQIKPLRQTILNLAIRGKLVEQDPTDEPASELLKRIGAEKARLIKAGKIRKSKSEPPPNWTKFTFDLPLGWSLARVDDVADIGTGLTPSKARQDFYESGQTPWINSSATSLNVISEAKHFVTDLAVKECRLKIYASGSLVVALYGQGKTRGQVSELGLDATVNQACAVLEWFPAFRELKQYVRLTLEQQYEAMRETAEGGPQPNLNVGKIKSRVVPLPPLAEQHRIVAKVDALMALCDRLEAALTTADTTRARLLEVLLHEALEPAAEVVTEAAE